MLSLDEIQRRLESGKWLYDPRWGWVERNTEVYARLMQLRSLEGEIQRLEHSAWRAFDRDLAREADRLGVTPAHLLEKLREPDARRRAMEAEQARVFPRRETKTVAEVYEVKSGGGMATFKGYLSTFGNTDLSGDIVDRGAFRKTLEEARAKPLSDRYLLPVLLHHDVGRPIGGYTTLREDIHGLAFTAELDTATRDGADAYHAVKHGYLKGMSIGYRVRDYRYDLAGARHLTDVALFEGSITTFPANPAARITSLT